MVNANICVIRLMHLYAMGICPIGHDKARRKDKPDTQDDSTHNPQDSIFKHCRTPSLLRILQANTALLRAVPPVQRLCTTFQPLQSV